MKEKTQTKPEAGQTLAPTACSATAREIADRLKKEVLPMLYPKENHEMLMVEITRLRSALSLRRDWLLSEAKRADAHSKTYNASGGLPSAAMLRNQAELIDATLKSPNAELSHKKENHE